ncbi:MAG: hypothetical protein ACK5N0_13130 [Synechococcaceae cyanobacterium]
MPRRPSKSDPDLQAHKEWLGYLQPRGLVVPLAAMGDAGYVLDRRSQQLLTRLRARVAAGQESADQFRPRAWRSGLRCPQPPPRPGCTSGRSRVCWSPPVRGSESAAGACASHGSSGC